MEGGIIEKRIFDPSRGGIGIKLNKANPRFVKTITEII
jgi:hypothetical protein